MKDSNNRGMLTDEIKVYAKVVLNRDISIRELRLYPYLDYGWKNCQRMEPQKLSLEEHEVIALLTAGGHIVVDEELRTYPSKGFYDFVQQILRLSYVITKEEKEKE